MSDDQTRQRRQDEAIQRKERVQEVASNLRQGNVPANDDLVQGIEKLRTSEAVDNTSKNMSPAGQQVMQNLNQVLDTSKQVIQEKNSGQQLQTIVQDGIHGSKGAADIGKQHVSDQHIRDGQASAQELAQEAGRRAWNVSRLMVTSREFRRLVADLESVVSDSIRASITGDEQMKQNIGSNIGDTREADPQDAFQRTGDTARGHAGDVYRAGIDNTQPTVDKYARGEATFTEAGQEIGSNVASGIKKSVSGINLTPEQRSTLLQRLKNILLEVHSSQEYQTALDDLIYIVRQIGEQGEQVGGQLKQAHESTQEAHGDHIDNVTQSSKQLVENFANGNSLDPLINSVREFGSHVKNDQEMRNYLTDLREFIHKSVRDTQFIQSEQYDQKASELLDRGQHEMKERYRGDTDRLLDQTKTFAQGFKDDVLNQKLAEDLQNLTKSIFLDDQGKPTFKYELFKDFASMIPVIAAQIEYLPLPPIENSDAEFDYKINNLVLRCSNVIPRYVKIHTETEVHMEPPSEHSDRVQSSGKGTADISNQVSIQLSHVRADARDVQFEFRKKTGLKVSDSGIADIHIPDRGLDVTMVVKNSTPNANSNVMEVVSVQCKLHELKLKMRDTKHDTMYKVLSPIINTAFKKNAEKAIAEELKKVLIRMDQRAGELQAKAQAQLADRQAQIKTKAQEAKANVQDTHQNVKSNLQNNANADGTTKTQEAKATLQDTHQAVKNNFQSNDNADGNVKSNFQSNANVDEPVRSNIQSNANAFEGNREVGK
ncbi:hypothetical protein BC943DRAFT_363114 [Umbelopsis sp. AD052]|nr:hypothetical protein BC943DRAFT_363114 [Umbelopsis sp. AD052]